MNTCFLEPWSHVSECRLTVNQLPFIHKFVISIVQNLEGAFCRETRLRPISRVPSLHQRNDVDKVWNILILFTAQHHQRGAFPCRIPPYLIHSFLRQIRREVIIVTLVLSGNWKRMGTDSGRSQRSESISRARHSSNCSPKPSRDNFIRPPALDHLRGNRHLFVPARIAEFEPYKFAITDRGLKLNRELDLTEKPLQWRHLLQAQPRPSLCWGRNECYSEIR